MYHRLVRCSPDGLPENIGLMVCIEFHIFFMQLFHCVYEDVHAFATVPCVYSYPDLRVIRCKRIFYRLIRVLNIHSCALVRARCNQLPAMS